MPQQIESAVIDIHHDAVEPFADLESVFGSVVQPGALFQHDRRELDFGSDNLPILLNGEPNISNKTKMVPSAL